ARVSQDTVQSSTYLFVQKETDQESDLQYFEARYMTAEVARFLSVDPVITNRMALLVPQRQHAYAYAANNPLRLTDSGALAPEEGKATSETKKDDTAGKTIETVAPLVSSGGDTAEITGVSKQLTIGTNATFYGPGTGPGGRGAFLGNPSVKTASVIGV